MPQDPGAGVLLYAQGIVFDNVAFLSTEVVEFVAEMQVPPPK